MDIPLKLAIEILINIKKHCQFSTPIASVVQNQVKFRNQLSTIHVFLKLTASHDLHQFIIIKFIIKSKNLNYKIIFFEFMSSVHVNQ